MDIEITTYNDQMTPALDALKRATMAARIKRIVGTAVTLEVQRHLNALPPNKRGWPSSGFYKDAARGTTWDETPDGVVIHVDVEGKPGAMRQRFHGGTIRMKDKLLAIPARAEFYGHSPTDFTNLRFAVFRSGAKALLVGGGGAGRVDFATGRERNVSGAGARAAGVVAYWLKESVEQEGDPSVLPSQERIAAVAVGAVMQEIENAGAGVRRGR